MSQSSQPAAAAEAANVIENRTFDEISIAESASLTRTLGADDIALFAVMSGDINPAHLDRAYAEKSMFHRIIAHGMWGGALISAVLGTKLPGPGTIYLGQDLKFRRPVGLGDTITVTVTAKEKRPEKHVVLFDCRCVNQKGEEVIMTFAAEHRIPVVSGGAIMAQSGALFTYGPRLLEAYSRTFVDRILRGAKPTDLPIEQPTVLELVINVKAASAAGLDLPSTLLARADQVIE